MRASLYVRVSTKDQTAENQERELRAWAERQGFEVGTMYADTRRAVREAIVRRWPLFSQEPIGGSSTCCSSGHSTA